MDRGVGARGHAVRREEVVVVDMARERRGTEVFERVLDPQAREYGFSLRNLRTGAGIRVSGSGKLSHMVFWACPTAACLEPYTPFRVFPGETGVWHIDYELLV